MAIQINFNKPLFRGDSDSYPFNLRQLRGTISTTILLTNLCNGGSGREIFSKPLGELIRMHVKGDWKKTHFLSFSTEEEVAFFYGKACNLNRDHVKVDDIKETWDFAIFTFDPTKLIQNSIILIDTGLYTAFFTPSSREFGQTCKIILIDAYSHLKSISNTKFDLTAELENAKRSKEWLILPAYPFGYNGEFTGKLDTHCITEKRVYRYE